MEVEAVKQKTISTPAFIIDADTMADSLNALIALREVSGCKLLYSVKALPFTAVLEWVKPHIDGFSVSSLFESRLAKEILAGKGSIHLTTPGIRPDEIKELSQLCSHISTNSLHQYELFANTDNLETSLGIRVNPELSFTADERYDPCRPFSKLGVPVDALIKSGICHKIRGLHFHTVFGASSFEPLLLTLAKLDELLAKNLPELKWLNLGGGYLYEKIADNKDFVSLVNRLRRNYGLDVFIEPGNAIAGRAGYLLTTVIDLFNSGGKTVAVMDTSVNHHPQVFEYQQPPALAGQTATGEYSAILAGSTCLAGDLFGEYAFSTPLRIGDRLLFENVGSYSLVKANRFNGYNLPDVYWHDSGKVNLIKTYSYAEYKQLWLNETGSGRS